MRLAEELEAHPIPLLIPAIRNAFPSTTRKFDPQWRPNSGIEFGDVKAKPRLVLNEMEIDQIGTDVAVKDLAPLAFFPEKPRQSGRYIGCVG